MKALSKFLLFGCTIAFNPYLSAKPHDWGITQSFNFGFEGGYYKYSEPGVMQNTGGLYGAFGEYRLYVKGLYFLLPDTYMLEGNIKGGAADYASHKTGSLDGIGHFLGEGRILLGKKFETCKAIELTPFVGFGYRYMDVENTQKFTTTGHSDYERESNYYYLPIGLKLGTEINQEWRLDAAAEYDVFIDGEQVSHLDNAVNFFPVISNSQNHGYGVRASIDLTRQINSVGFLVGTYFRWWDISSSEIDKKYRIYEPKNETLEIGLRAGLAF